MRGNSSPCAAAAKCPWSRCPYGRRMGAATVGRLLYEIGCDEVVPVRYSRKSLAVRSFPLLQMAVAAVGVVVLGIVLGRL